MRLTVFSHLVPVISEYLSLLSYYTEILLSGPVRLFFSARRISMYDLERTPEQGWKVCRHGKRKQARHVPVCRAKLCAVTARGTPAQNYILMFGQFKVVISAIFTAFVKIFRAL